MADNLRRSTRSLKVVDAVEDTDVNHERKTSDPAFATQDAITAITAIELPIIPSLVKSEPLEHGQALASIPAATHYTTVKAEPDLDEEYIPVKMEPRTRKNIKRELSDEEAAEIEKPKRKRTKKEKAPQGPHRLVITAGMIRPPGEKQPPMIYPVEKKPRDPKLPSVLSEMVANFSARIERARARIPRLQPGEEETRLLPFVETPNDHYYAAVDRANTQRLFVLQRERGVDDDCHAGHHDCPIEDFLMTGSTGNVYNVTITHLPTCSCADYMFRKRNCKHIFYVLHNVLKVPEHLKHQDAFLTSELREIAAHAPPMPEQVKQEANDGHRKPIEDDCPICCMAFVEGEDVVWCQAACGNNVHQQCFQRWAQTRPDRVTCPFCRTEWQNDALLKQSMVMTEVKMPMMRNSNGYYNVAGQLGYD